MKIRSLLLGLLLSLSLLATQPTPAIASSGPLFARSSGLNRYWENFQEFWLGSFRNSSAVALTVIGVGAVAMFIITRGKWQK
jgi:type IV secretory pathway VirB2 component (pilin)